MKLHQNTVGNIRFQWVWIAAAMSLNTFFEKKPTNLCSVLSIYLHIIIAKITSPCLSTPWTITCWQMIGNCKIRLGGKLETKSVEIKAEIFSRLMSPRCYDWQVVFYWNVCQTRVNKTCKIYLPQKEKKKSKNKMKKRLANHGSIYPKLTNGYLNENRSMFLACLSEIITSGSPKLFSFCCVN